MMKDREQTKPYLMPDLEKRMTLELEVDHLHQEQYIVRVFLDEQLLFIIWCDRISVTPGGGPPTYSLYHGYFNMVSFTPKMMTLSKEVAKAVLSQEAMAKLGKYIQVEEPKERGSHGHACRSKKSHS
jgi:hypothetical protein